MGYALALLLANDVSVDDLHRFPPWHQCFCAGSLGTWRSNRLDSAKALQPWRADIQEEIDETKAFQKPWFELQMAWEQAGWSRNDKWIRHYLRQLRECIGDEAYSLGQMPPPLPWWRLPQVP